LPVILATAPPGAIIVRYEGPKGGPGMPEQLKASAALMGAKLTNVAHKILAARDAAFVQSVVELVFLIKDTGFANEPEPFKGGPGMPEQLKASAALMGAKLTNVALITDGRYSGWPLAVPAFRAHPWGPRNGR
jgi:dihydroxy-acid dehydratase